MPPQVIPGKGDCASGCSTSTTGSIGEFSSGRHSGRHATSEGKAKESQTVSQSSWQYMAMIQREAANRQLQKTYDQFQAEVRGIDRDDAVPAPTSTFAESPSNPQQPGEYGE